MHYCTLNPPLHSDWTLSISALVWNVAIIVNSAVYTEYSLILVHDTDDIIIIILPVLHIIVMYVTMSILYSVMFLVEINCFVLCFAQDKYYV